MFRTVSDSNIKSLWLRLHEKYRYCTNRHWTHYIIIGELVIIITLGITNITSVLNLRIQGLLTCGTVSALWLRGQASGVWICAWWTRLPHWTRRFWTKISRRTRDRKSSSCYAIMSKIQKNVKTWQQEIFLGVFVNLYVSQSLSIFIYHRFWQENLC